jgi:hypothetical protein
LQYLLFYCGIIRGPEDGPGQIRSDLALDALEMAIWTRRYESADGLVRRRGGCAATSMKPTLEIRTGFSGERLVHDEGTGHSSPSAAHSLKGGQPQ